MRKLFPVAILLLAYGSAHGQPTGAGVRAETQASFMGRCRAEYAVRYPGARGAEATCGENWTRVGQSAPMVDVILALAGQGPELAAARARIPGAFWSPRPMSGALASGRLGAWQVSLTGRGGVEDAAFSWGAVGELPPFDVPEALKVRGARVSEVACQGFGAGESNRVYRVDMAGRPPFGLTIYDRTAPTANANSTYSVTLALRGAAPTLAALRAAPNGSDWQARCD